MSGRTARRSASADPQAKAAADRPRPKDHGARSMPIISTSPSRPSCQRSRGRKVFPDNAFKLKNFRCAAVAGCRTTCGAARSYAVAAAGAGILLAPRLPKRGDRRSSARPIHRHALHGQVSFGRRSADRSDGHLLGLENSRRRSGCRPQNINRLGKPLLHRVGSPSRTPGGIGNLPMRDVQHNRRGDRHAIGGVD